MQKKKYTRQIPQGKYAYCKYLEIIRVGVFEWEQKQVAAAAGGLNKNNIVGEDLKTVASYMPENTALSYIYLSEKDG